MDSLTLKRHNSFQIKVIEKPHAVLLPDLLIFKFQQEVLKSNDICVSLSSPKTELDTNFLQLKNQSF